MNKISKYIIISTLILSGYSCSTNVTSPNITATNNSQISTSKYLLTGKVQFPENFKVKADITDVAKIATISVISNNQTVATGLSDTLGSFSINFNTGFSPNNNDIFILQATRRVNTNQNISLATFIKWDGSNWQSITQPQLVINEKTTAITIISSLTPVSLPAADAINSINNSTNTVSNIGIITSDKITQLANKVSLLVKKDNDPLSKIKYDNNDYIVDSKDSLAEFLLSGICNYCSLEGANLSNTNIDYVDLSNSTLNNSNLSSSKFIGGYFTNTNIRNSVINNIEITGSDLTNADFTDSHLNNSVLDNSFFNNTKMINSELNKASINFSTIKNSYFINAELNGVSLSNSKISDTDFSGANFDSIDNKVANLVRVYLKNSNLSNAHLVNADLRDITMDNVNLTGTDLTNADLSGSFMSDVIVSIDTKFTNANLSGADLEGLDLTGVNITGAILDGATWTNGKICQTNSVGQCVTLN